LRATAPLCLRPVRPAPSAWHEMPCYVVPGSLRPVRAALSRTLRVRCESGVQQRALRGAFGCLQQPSCVYGLQGQFHQPGMKCQVRSPPCSLRPVRAALSQMLRVPCEPGVQQRALRGKVGCVQQPSCVYGLQGQIHQPGMKCQVRPPVAASPCKGSSQPNAACSV
jgi:hypothetical protein